MKLNVQKFKDGGQSKKVEATFGLPEVNIYPQNEFGDIARSQGIRTARNWRTVKEGTTKGVNDFYNDPRTQMVMAGLPLPSMLDAAGDAIKVVGPIIKNSKVGQLIGNLLSKNKKTFKSQINWGKWNKEIPKNKELLNEYNTIEQQAKSSGTWMKNPNGTSFPGTPEQFVQQQSSNFKRVFPEGAEITYRGVLKNKPTLSDFGENQDNAIFTANRELANKYGNRTDDPLRPLITSGKDKSGVHQLYSKNSKNNLFLDAAGDDWANIDLSDIGYKKTLLKHSIDVQQENLPRFLDDKKSYEIIKNKLNDDLERFKRLDDIKDDRIKIRNDLKNNNDLSEFVNVKDKTWTDGLAKYVKNRGINKIKIKDINDGGYGNIIIHNNRIGNYLKSAIGNNGMFDMTNPNIYKTIIGGAAIQQLNKNKDKNK